MQKTRRYGLDFCGYHYLQFLISYNLYLLKERRKPFQLTYKDLYPFIVVVTLFLGFFKLTLFYWFLPQATIQFGLLKIHGYGEHSKRRGRIENCTFNHKVGFLKRFLIYPLNSNLHLEQHLQPLLTRFQLAPQDSQ